MSVLEDLATWLEEADRFRCDARLPSPELTEWPDFPKFTVTVIGAPAVGKSTLLTGLIAPAESPFEPAPVSTALRDPAAYRRAPLNWGSTVDAESASVIVRGRTRSPALAGTLFGLRLREGWGFAVEAEESTNATLAEVLPKHGKGATILVLRAEAPLSRAELEGIRALASAGRAPEIIVANVRGGMGLEDQGKVRTFVARQLEGLGPDANLPVMVADVSSGTGDGDEAKVRAAIDGAIRAHAAVAKAAALLECACLGAPSDLALARAKLEEDKVAAAAVAAQRSDQAERLRDQVDEAQKSMEAVIAGIDRRREERKKAIAGSAGVDVPRTAAEWAERRSAIQATVGAHLLPPPDLEPRRALPIVVAVLLAGSLLALSMRHPAIALLLAVGAVLAAGAELRGRRQQRLVDLSRASNAAELLVDDDAEREMSTERLMGGKRIAGLQEHLERARAQHSEAIENLRLLDARSEAVEGLMERRMALSQRLSEILPVQGERHRGAARGTKT